MAEALVKGAVVRWARERVGLTVQNLADKLGTPAERVVAWESGDRLPTVAQVDKIASLTHVPLGYLFLDEPPDQTLPIPDFRTGRQGRSDLLDADLYDLLNDIQYKVAWYREYRLEQGAQPLPYVGRFKDRLGEKLAVVKDIRTTLGISAVSRIRARTPEEYLRTLIAAAEAVGLWVMRSGTISGNTHRTLDPKVFRGFAISDEIVPVVFLNREDAERAQLFTLIHELAHIWLGASGISDVSLTTATPATRQEVEKFCNQVAAQVLVPQREFMDQWQPDLSLDDNARQLSSHFRVSRVVIARRAVELRLADEEKFESYYRVAERQWVIERENASGGDYYRSAIARNGNRFTRAVIASTLSNRTLWRDASQLLNMTPRTIRELDRRLESSLDQVSVG